VALGIENVRVGVVTDVDNATGCTVILAPAGSVGGFAVRGGAPGTREAAVLSAGSPSSSIHAVALCGSSLFGLSAAGGVADWCAANDIGLSLPGGRFPIVGAAVVMDVHSPEERRIGPQDGWDACEAATNEAPAEGSVGVGTGCTVGKEGGRDWGSKGGQGWAICSEGDITVGALMAVNAFGSIYRDSELLAGCRAPVEFPRYPAASPSEMFDANGDPVGEAEWGAMSDGPTTNTVIGVVVTNAKLSKAEACRVADLAHGGITRTVSPAHTNMDGDAMFAISTGTAEASADLIADMAATAVANAIHSAVISATEIAARSAWPVDRRGLQPGP